MHPQKSGSEIVTLNLCPFRFWGYIGSMSAPDEATLKDEAYALQCTVGGPCNASPTNLLCVGSICGLGPDLVGIRSISLAARCRTAASSNTLSQGLEKMQASRGYDLAPIFALSSEWEEKFLISSMARSTGSVSYCTLLGSQWQTCESPQDKKAKGCHSLDG